MSLPQPRITEAIFLFWLLLPGMAIKAQPYIDLGKISYYNSPAPDDENGIKSQLYSINATAPIELKKGGDVILLNPFFEQNNARADIRNLRVTSTGIIAGFLNKGIISKWDLMTAVVIRKNQEAKKDPDDKWQTGGLILATFKQNELRSFKVGLYYNREFFGNFFMPLLGVDWKINDHTNLFGVLPGSMILERKLNRYFYVGASFRALTNSYRLSTVDSCTSGDCVAKNYLRINDNQLGVFADMYLSNRIVFSAEAGYTILRKYRFGLKDSHHTYIDSDNDHWYVKGMLAYRLRF